MKSWPPSSSTAVDIASATMIVSCHHPEPMPATIRSARKTPTATPTVTSATRRRRCPYDVPRLTTAAIGAKNGVAWPTTSCAMNQATPAAIAHWPICQLFDCHRSARFPTELRREVRPRLHSLSSDSALPWASMPPIVPGHESGRPTPRGPRIAGWRPLSIRPLWAS